MFKILGLVAILGAALALTLGSAAKLNVEGSVIQAGSDGTLYCDEDGVSVNSYQVNNNGGATDGVLGVSIEGVDADCAGARLYLRVEDASGSPLAFSRPVAGACYASSNGIWGIAQADDTSFNGLYTFQMVTAAGGSTQAYVDETAIEKITIWVEGTESDGTECP